MNKKYNHRTDFLFPKSSFLIGAGSIVALFGNYYTFNFSNTAAKTDLRALRSDWGMVGNDFRKAFSMFDERYKNLTK